MQKPTRNTKSDDGADKTPFRAEHNPYDNKKDNWSVFEDTIAFWDGDEREAKKYATDLNRQHKSIKRLKSWRKRYI